MDGRRERQQLARSGQQDPSPRANRSNSHTRDLLGSWRGRGPTYSGSVASAKPAARHLVRARDLADSRYIEPLTVEDLADAAHMSRAHFSREFKKAFGESPHSYLLTRRLERAAALLRSTDWAVADICMSVGLTSVGSFTTSFSTAYGMSPTAYRAHFPPAAALVPVPGCILRAYGRPTRLMTARIEKTRPSEPSYLRQ